MSRFVRFQPRLYARPALAALAALSALLAAGSQAQPQQPPQLSVAPNPYRRIDAWLHAPAGRTLGSVSSVAAARDGSVWIAERCGANDCSTSDLAPIRSEEHTSELQSQFHLVCRLLLEKKNKQN